MKLENQVCTKEQAQKLKDLGVAQKSIFYHHPNFERPVFGEQVTTVFGKVYKKTQVCNDKNAACSAFTVGELVAMNSNTHGIDVSISVNHKGTFYRQTDGFGSGEDAKFTYYVSFAEACSAKLIDAIEKQFITAEEVNQRLLNS